MHSIRISILSIFDRNHVTVVVAVCITIEIGTDVVVIVTALRIHDFIILKNMLLLMLCILLLLLLRIMRVMDNRSSRWLTVSHARDFAVATVRIRAMITIWN